MTEELKAKVVIDNSEATAALKETAEEYAFILWQMGHADAAA